MQHLSSTQRAVQLAGGPSAVGRAMGISPQAVGQWERVPPERALKLSELSGMQPHELRPDIYPLPEQAGAA